MSDFRDKYERYEDDELIDAIHQLSSEAAFMPDKREELDAAREVAQERGIFV